MEPYLDEGKQVVEKLGSSEKQGLTPAQIVTSAEKYGRNEFTKEKGPSLFKRIIQAGKDPMMIILIVAALITIGVNVVKAVAGQETDFVEAVGILFAIALSIGITIVMEGRSQKAFDALNKLKDNIMVKCLRDGKITMISQKDLVVGDILYFETGDKIPVDCRILSAMDLGADESSLTGESMAVEKTADTLSGDIPLAERTNMLYSGSFITGGSCQCIVTAVGDQTEFGKIAKELKDTESKSTPLQEKMERLGKVISLVGIVIATLIFIIQLIQLLMTGDFNFNTLSEAFITSIVLIVATVPEGLPTIMAVTLALNVIKMAKQNALVKKMIACETVGSINIICSDKTGTLTENKMTVENIYAGGSFIQLQDLKSVYLVDNFCLNSTVNVEDNGKSKEFIGNPTEGALIVAYENSQYRKDSGCTYLDIRESNEVLHSYPFSSEEKRMSTVVGRGDKKIIYTKGSPEKILSLCKWMRIGEKLEPIEDYREQIEELLANFQAKAMRTLGFAHKELVGDVDYKEGREAIESEMIFDGFVAIRDPIRKEVYGAVKGCFKAGVSVKMLTGDNKVTAEAIAKELHIIEGGKKGLVLTASDIEELDDEALEAIIDDIRVIARSTPMTKLRVIKLLKKRGNVVAVTGDGINDAPAIKSADVGISMGITGTEVSKEASDIVLLDDSFSTIVKAVKWGRGIYENFQRFIQFQLTVNVSAVLTVVTAILLGMHSPFTAIQLLWINIIMDGPPAVTLGLEPVSDQLMDRMPTPRGDNIITKRMMGRIVTNGIFIAVVVIGQMLFPFIPLASGQEGTVLFCLFVLFQLFNAFNCRELGNGSIFKSFGRNKLMVAVFFGTFLLQVLITQVGGSFFSTTPLSFFTWLCIIGVAFSVVLLSEGIKVVGRMKK